MEDKIKIKVCIISTIQNAHIIRWEKILTFKGYDVIIISSDPNKYKPKGVKVIECLIKNYKSYFKRMLHQLNRSICIRRIVKNLKPEIVHIHSLDYIHPLMIGLVNCLSSGFPNLIVSTWGTDIIGNKDSVRTWRGEFAKKLLLKQAKEITATSHYLANETAKLLPKGKKVHVIPFGVDCDMFRRKGKLRKNKTVQIGFVKSLTPKYGPEYLLKAMALIVKQCQDVCLIMVGHGKLESYLKRLASDLGIENNIRFLGLVQYEEVPEILSNIDIFVMPSTENSETFGVAAIEAQAMEIPVVASNVGGVSEAVLDGETGLLVEPRNIRQLATAIIKLIEDPELRKYMGKKGKQFVLNNYNIEDNVVLVEHLYNKLARSS